MKANLWQGKKAQIHNMLPKNDIAFGFSYNVCIKLHLIKNKLQCKNSVLSPYLLRGIDVLLELFPKLQPVRVRKR